MTSTPGRGTGKRAAIRRTYLGPGATTTARTPAELKSEAWRYVSTVLAGDPSRTVTARELAKACTLTHSGAHAYLTTWNRHGHLTRAPGTGKPAPYDDHHTYPLARPLSLETPMPVPDRTPSRMTTVRRDALIPAALDYAARGWHVFPLRPDDKRPAFPAHPEHGCSPDTSGADVRCHRAGRHVGWQERATTDPSRIRRAWQQAPYGIGIACGPSGLVVLDLDTPKPDQPNGAVPQAWDQPGIHDGADVLAALCETAGTALPLGDTYTVRTGRGGLHLYFTAPPSVPGRAEMRCTAGQLGWLIDTRAAGGYVVAPPSTANGHRYVIEVDAPVAALPAWLGTALTPKPLPAQEPVTVPLRAALTDRGDLDTRQTAYLSTAVQQQLDILAAATPGNRNPALYRSANALGQLVAGGHLEADDITARLEQVAHQIGLEPTETAKTIASGLRAGANRPRTLTTSTLGAAA